MWRVSFHLFSLNHSEPELTLNTITILNPTLQLLCFQRNLWLQRGMQTLLKSPKRFDFNVACTVITTSPIVKLITVIRSKERSHHMGKELHSLISKLQFCSLILSPAGTFCFISLLSDQLQWEEGIYKICFSLNETKQTKTLARPAE